jgi:hypothetical protein
MRISRVAGFHRPSSTSWEFERNADQHPGIPAAGPLFFPATAAMTVRCAAFPEVDAGYAPIDMRYLFHKPLLVNRLTSVTYY